MRPERELLGPSCDRTAHGWGGVFVCPGGAVGFFPLFPLVGVEVGVLGGVVGAVVTGAVLGTPVVPVVGATVGPAVGTPGVGMAVTGATDGVVAPSVGAGDCVAPGSFGLPVGSPAPFGVAVDSFV